MYKLLTEEEKKKVRTEYQIRRAVVMLVSLVVVIGIGVIGLVPSYVLSSARQKEIEGKVKTIASTELKNGTADLRSWLKDFNLKLNKHAPAPRESRPSELIEKALAEKGSSIRFVSFLSEKADSQIILTISGIARDRQALLLFENRLNDSGNFSSVTLPLSNLAKERDINFEVKLSPKTP